MYGFSASWLISLAIDQGFPIFQIRLQSSFQLKQPMDSKHQNLELGFVFSVRGHTDTPPFWTHYSNISVETLAIIIHTHSDFSDKETKPNHAYLVKKATYHFLYHKFDLLKNLTF